MMKEVCATQSVTSRAAQETGKYNNLSSNLKSNWGRFNKAKMLYPIAVLDILGIKPGKANAGGYWKIRCPFHKNGQEKNPSLNIHQESGHFKCQACGAKGGDIIGLYRQITGATFIDAAKALGAWEDAV
jgi:CHC2-type zinc finger protein